MGLLCKLSLHYILEIFLGGFGNFAITVLFHDLRNSMAKYISNSIGHITWIHGPHQSDDL